MPSFWWRRPGTTWCNCGTWHCCEEDWTPWICTTTGRSPEKFFDLDDTIQPNHLMSPPVPPQPPPDFKDPRGMPGFLPQFFPRANGQDAPPPDTAPWEDRVMLEFLGIYYE